MTLSSLWNNAREQLQGKHIQQIIAFAGDGKLRDGGVSSTEFREFLEGIPSSLLTNYANECLQSAFTDSGLALQDIVNQVGKRLGFSVEHGRYRGTRDGTGYDGIWHGRDGNSIIIEVKTTDAYRIDLDKLANYRRKLVADHLAATEKYSILIVVGRENTGDLEAQIRGSRYAWDIRLISIESLIRLMQLKEDVEDPNLISKIHAILVPREFTKLDEIVEILFSTAEDIKQEETIVQEDEENVSETPATPVSFHAACIERIEKNLNRTFLKRSRTTYSNADDTLGLTCAVSKEYEKGNQVTYWFAFHPYQRDFLESKSEGYAAFGCGSAENVLLIPSKKFLNWLDEMLTTENETRKYWHVNIVRDGSKLILYRRKGSRRIDLTSFLIG